MHNLNSQKSLGNYQYPIKIVKTNNVFSKHKLGISNNKKQYHKHPKSNQNKEDKEDEDIAPLSFGKMEKDATVR